jgi:(p)ppGpp synthase/HD superfamily hydrolase
MIPELDLEKCRKAREFAIRKHGDQMRDFNPEPYWHHCGRVSNRLIRYCASTSIVVAGWLHDTLEDTDATYEELVKEFGVESAEIVLEVTNVSRPEHGKRPMRKRLDRQYIAGASWKGQMVKCADIMDNVPSMVEHNVKFAQIYVAEKREQLIAMINIRQACYPIWADAFEVIKAGERSIAQQLIDVRSSAA